MNLHILVTYYITIQLSNRVIDFEMIDCVLLLSIWANLGIKTILTRYWRCDHFTW